MDVTSATDTIDLQKLIDRVHAGDSSANDELVNRACERLRRLTRKMLKTYPKVARWEQTDDVLQNATLRLCVALKQTTPRSVPHFFNLAALFIRRELIDLSRHYFGPHGAGSHHDSAGRGCGIQPSANPVLAVSQTTFDPSKLAQWREFHEQVDALPTEERQLFDLLWYQGLSQAEASMLLSVSERTVQRRWQSARLKIFDALKGSLPD